MTDEFYNYHRKKSFKSIRNTFLKLYSSNIKGKINAAEQLNSFFCECPYWGQLLTDFNNGDKFKELLQHNGYEGYSFMETYSSITYCIWNSDKLSKPIHEIIDIDNNSEIQQLMYKDINER